MLRWILLMLIGCSMAAGPTTRPTTRPMTKPATAPARVRDGLLKGAVRFLVPPDWEIVERKEDGLSVAYRLPDGKSIVSMLVTQQPQAIPPRDQRVRAQMIKAVLGWDNDALKRRNAEVIDAPKVEMDDRFMLKVHERFKDGHDPYDVAHFYRGVGLNLISVTAAAVTEDQAEAKTVHEAAALMLMSVTTGVADPKIVRPVTKAE